MKSQLARVGQVQVPSVQSDPLHAAHNIAIARTKRLMRRSLPPPLRSLQAMTLHELDQIRAIHAAEARRLRHVAIRAL